MTFLALDGGTTNTRIVLMRDGTPDISVKLAVGAGSYREKSEYFEAISKGISELLERSVLTEADIECVVASGMVTSEKGLYELPHISVPAGINELAHGMKEVSFPEISSIPFWFIPGVKQVSENLCDTDMMRGEETELTGLCDNILPNCMYVLPGSHSKLILTDGNGRITSFKTMLTGEMLASLSAHTILRDAVSFTDVSIDECYLNTGCEYAESHGLNEALFKVRILKNLLGADKNEVYSFFLGAVLQGEIGQIVASGAEKVVVGGKAALRSSMLALLQSRTESELIDAGERSDIASAIGAARILEFSN